MSKPMTEREQQVSAAADDYEMRELKADLADAAAFLLPIAQEHYQSGKWGIEPAAWLTMVKDSFAPRAVADIN